MTQLKNRRKKSVTLVVAAGLTLAGTGVAFAYWTAEGSGDGSATTGTTTPFQISSQPPQGDPLAPGVLPGQTVAFIVSNPGPGVQQISTVSVRVANTDGSDWTDVLGCSAADFAVGLTNDPSNLDVAPGDSLQGEATISMVDSGINQDGCKDVTVPLYFTVGAVA